MECIYTADIQCRIGFHAPHNGDNRMYLVSCIKKSYDVQNGHYYRNMT